MGTSFLAPRAQPPLAATLRGTGQRVSLVAVGLLMALTAQANDDKNVRLPNKPLIDKSQVETPVKPGAATASPATAPASAAAKGSNLANQMRDAIQENKGRNEKMLLTTSGNQADKATLTKVEEPKANVIAPRVTNRPIMPVRPRAGEAPGVATPIMGALSHTTQPSGRKPGAASSPEAIQAQYERDRARAHGLSVPAGTRLTANKPVAEAHGYAKTGDHGEPHWSYSGEHGPEQWGRMKPDFHLCALGKRQSPINIQPGNTLLGPAEPLQINYTPSTGSVVNNGHTIQVDVEGDNTLRVRNSSYRLLQFHFHHPSEETVDGKPSAMVAHLVHRNLKGELAVLAVPLDPGEPNELIERVWTHMPLEVNDRVRLPTDWINLSALLPQDQRYYQFMGSLTTPPCTEGVLWMVLKTPQTLSPTQLRLFARLFPLNARPVQPLNDRVVREAQ